MAWSAEDIPDQTGKVAIVTGANTGIGYEIARALARKKAIVILACRNSTKGEAALQRILREQSSAKVRFMRLDLADLSSVQGFARDFADSQDRADVLVNCAGVMATPFAKTVDGFELQFGTNHLGHFALTGLLLNVILNTPHARVVTMSSGGHRFGQMEFDNLNGQKRYDPQTAYAQSKLANLLFTYELQRRLAAFRQDAIAVAAHPGWTRTELAVHWRMVRILSRLIGQTPEMGALPALYAATATDVQGGDYYGPEEWMGIRGYPAKSRSSESSYDLEVAARLWSVSEELTGVRYLDTPRQL
jgi:NAD(P)-dependent dehydrogenase (short-subunit alcohol dehydrogenase family)